MLIIEKGAPTKPGIAVTQWKVDGELRTFALFPILEGKRGYLEVECICGENYQVIEPETEGWGPLKDGFGEDSYGYPMNKATRIIMDMIWDDGATKHQKEVDELSAHYSYLFQYYADAQHAYMEKISQENYDQEVGDAKKNGWDTNLIQKR